MTSGRLTIEGAGQIGGTADDFHFVYQRISGDVDLAVRVDSLEDLDAWARAGLMIRGGLGARARHAFLSVSSRRGVNFERRRIRGGDTARKECGAGSAPVWLRLVRSGDKVAAYRSSDGSSWTLVRRVAVSMRATVYAGFAVSSDRPARTATAVFSNVTLRAGATLPEPWLMSDVGGIEPGEAQLSSGVFSMSGAGAGFGGTSDQFQFAFQQVRGDIEITARLATLGNAAEAGVTVRDGLGQSAAHATLLGTVLPGWEFRRRVSRGDRTHRTAGPAGRTPGWIRVVREGDLFTAYHSPDGTRWTLVDSDRIAMPNAVNVGLVVSSDSASTLATATFDSVLVRRPRTTNDPPQVSIVKPLSGATFAAGVSIPLQASATDPDGAIAGVDFYVDNTKVSTDVTSPFAAAWTAAPGSHLVAAIARDSDGASTTATAVIFVGSPTTGKTATLRFVPSADHAKNVSSYSLSIYHAADPLTAAPVKKAGLGKPQPVDGEITVDVSSLIGSLAAGAYKVVVTASNASGSTASEPAPIVK